MRCNSSCRHAASAADAAPLQRCSEAAATSEMQHHLQRCSTSCRETATAVICSHICRDAATAEEMQQHLQRYSTVCREARLAVKMQHQQQTCIINWQTHSTGCSKRLKSCSTNYLCRYSTGFRDGRLASEVQHLLQDLQH